MTPDTTPRTEIEDEIQKLACEYAESWESVSTDEVGGIWADGARHYAAKLSELQRRVDKNYEVHCEQFDRIMRLASERDAARSELRHEQRQVAAKTEMLNKALAKVTEHTEPKSILSSLTPEQVDRHLNPEEHARKQLAERDARIARLESLEEHTAMACHQENMELKKKLAAVEKDRDAWRDLAEEATGMVDRNFEFAQEWCDRVKAQALRGEKT